MKSILVRGLSDKMVEKLKEQAKRNRRSLQAEAKLILERGTQFSVREARHVTRRWQRQLAERKFGDSAALVRADRDR